MTLQPSSLLWLEVFIQDAVGVQFLQPLRNLQGKLDDHLDGRWTICSRQKVMGQDAGIVTFYTWST